MNKRKNYDAIKNEDTKNDFTPQIRYFPHLWLPYIAQNINFVQLEQKIQGGVIRPFFFETVASQED